MNVESTSTTLLRDISSSADNVRWPEFVSRYRPMMLAYLKSHFQTVDADDMVQETLVALFNALPYYHYSPDETGRFRNYLTGILRNKALKQCEKVRRNQLLKGKIRNVAIATPASDNYANDDYVAWRTALVDIAMRQLLVDKLIPDRSKQIFQRLVVDGKSPDEVAASYGTSRNNVDKVKSRMMARLRDIVKKLEAAGGI